MAFPFSTFPRLVALQEQTVVLAPDQFQDLQAQINGVGLWLGGIVLVAVLLLGVLAFVAVLGGR